MTLGELHWVAGFLEGEGSFMLKAGKYPMLSAEQKQVEPLLKLRALLGGIIGQHKTRPIWYWHHTRSAQAAGIMMTLWTLMSSRRRGQIEHALAAWR